MDAGGLQCQPILLDLGTPPSVPIFQNALQHLKTCFLSRPNFTRYDHQQADQKIVQSLGFHAGLCVG